MTHEIAIVIATRDRAEQCEAAWRSVHDVLPRAQLIVVEQVTENEEYPIAPDFAGTWIRQRAVGVGRARNLGFSYVDRPYVVFLDDDAVVIPGVVDLLRSHIQNGRDVTCGRVRYGGESSGPYGSLPMLPRRVGQMFMEFSAIWNTDALRLVGGFDERFGPGCELGAEEGAELLGRLHGHGVSMFHFDPIDAFVHPRVDAPSRDKARSYGRGLGALVILSPSWWMFRYVGYTTVRTLVAVTVFALRGSFAEARFRTSRLNGIVGGFRRAVMMRLDREQRPTVDPHRATVVTDQSACVGR